MTFLKATFAKPLFVCSDSNVGIHLLTIYSSRMKQNSNIWCQLTRFLLGDRDTRGEEGVAQNHENGLATTEFLDPGEPDSPYLSVARDVARTTRHARHVTHGTRRGRVTR